MIDITEREISVASYWPPFFHEYQELMQIAISQDIELQECLKVMESIHHNNYAYTADIVGLARFEKLLGIIVPENATLEDRRIAIIARLNVRMPYTKRVLKRFLDNLVGTDGYTMSIDYANHKVTIKIELKRRNQVNAVNELLRKVLPANMLYDLQIRFNQWYMLTKFTYAELAQMTCYNLKNSPMVKEEYIRRGGVLM